jgi:hypothetical protein
MMNEIQRERNRRFAAMRTRQKDRELARKHSKGHKVTVEKGKSPQGPMLGDENRNVRMKHLFADLAGAGRYVVEHFREGKKIGQYELKNGIVNEGLNSILGVYFFAATQFTTWYLGLIDNSGFTALSSNDIYDDINQAGNGWDEFDDYTDANNASSAVTRPEWPTDAPSGQSITNSTQAIYDITATGVVKGIFVVAGTNAATKNDHTAGAAHKLWSTALFSGGNVSVVNGDQLKVTYTVNATSA